MKHVVSVGGGISSTWLLMDRVIEKYGKQNVFPVICEIANEHPDLWRLVEAVENKYGIVIKRLHGIVKSNEHGKQIEWTRNPVDIWDVFFYTGMMGSIVADPCSRMLKRELMAQYMIENFDPADTVLHVGITAGEIDRMLAITANWKRSGYKVEADLADMPALTREKQIDMCQKEFGFVPALYRMGIPHNNCSGFCIKAGHGAMARLLWYDRKTFLYHETMELLHRQTFAHESTIMIDRKQRRGVLQVIPLTLRAFRLRMENKWRSMLPGFDPFDGLDDTPGCRYCDSTA